MQDRLKKVFDKLDRRARKAAAGKSRPHTGLTPYDQPQEAHDFYAAKRMPPGGGGPSLPLRIEAALAEAERMPLYSTAEGRFVSGGSSPRKIERAAAQDQQQPNELLGAWQPLGPGNIGGRTRALLIHPTTPNIMLASGVAGGVWKTTDGGATWTPKADNLVNLAINSMIFDPRNPNLVYAGTGEGYFNGDAVRGRGIFKSTDLGETWTQLGSTDNSDFFYVQKLAVTRGSAQRIYAATRTGIFRSSDAGATWQKVLNGTAVNGCMDIVIQTDRPLANVFAACGTFVQSAIYRALDTAGAQTWTSVHAPAGMGRTSLALAPSNQNIIYALSASTASGTFLDGLHAVYRSTASGAAGSWTTRVSNTSTVTLNRLLLTNPVISQLTACGFGSNIFLNQGWYDNALAVDPLNPDIVWAGGIDTFRSNDGGANWGQASHWWFTPGVDPEYNHADNHAFVFHPQYNGTSNQTMYVMSDGGIHRTTNARGPVAFSPDPITAASPVCGNTPPGTVAWTSLNVGYEVTQYYHGLPFPDGESFFGGTQDNGTLRGSIALGRDGWSEIRGGDGGYVALNPANTNQVWVETTGLSIARSNNGGASFVGVTSGITEAPGNFLFITPFIMDPSNANRMWIGGAFLWRADSATVTPAPNPYWTQASTFLGARVSAIAVAPSDSNRVYAGTQTGRVFTTNIAGTATSATVWSSAALRSGTSFVSWVAVHPTDPLTAYATVSTFNSGASTGHVFKTINAGASWTNIDGVGVTGIPDVPVHCIVVDPANTSRLYIGTDIGVFSTTDGGANWARENTGFANVVVESLAINTTGTRRLFAFTHGRSVWRVNLP